METGPVLLPVSSYLHLLKDYFPLPSLYYPRASERVPPVDGLLNPNAIQFFFSSRHVFLFLVKYT